MDSRERTFLALNFEEPDRVPIDLWLSKGQTEKLESALGTTKEQFMDAHDVDLRYIDGPAYFGPPLRTFPGGMDEDIWGVRRQSVTVPTPGGCETYKEVALSPLASVTTVEEINAYDHWPSADWFDYSEIVAQCEKLHDQGRVVVFVGDRLNRIAQLKPAMYIRGTEQILLDMYERPEFVEAIIANIRSFCRSYAERIFDAARGKIDIVLTGDDFGSQHGPLISPTMWEEFLGNGFADYVLLAKSHGLIVMHHTCGSVRPIIPMMIERGLDILQSLQPEAAQMAPRDLKADFGDRLAFQGGLSIQKTLPFGTLDDVRNEVKDRAAALAPGGGYIFCTSHNIQADVPVENVEALLRAYHEHGRY